MQNFYDNIEPYLDETLSQAEIVEFEQQLSVDATLQRAVAEEKATRATLFAMMNEGFRQRALEEDKNAKQEAKIVAMQPRNNWYRWAIAATTIGILLMAVFYLNQNKSIDYVALTEKYTYDYPTPKVQADNGTKQVTDAFYTAIKNKEFDTALKTYEQLPIDMQNNEDLLFYKAFCFLKTKQFQVAKSTFQAAAIANPNPNPSLKEPIEWYILMAKLGEKQDIRAELEAIAKDNNHSYQAKAKELLETIE